MPDESSMNTLRFLDRLIARIEGGFIIAFLTGMLGFTFLQVILRAFYTFGHFQWANLLLGHIDWGEPFSRLAVLWITFLGASLLTGENRHIKIDIASGLLPPRWLPFREIILCLAAALVCGLMFKASLHYLALETGSGSVLFLGIPVWLTRLILPIGFGLILFRLLLRGLEEYLILMRGTRR